MMSRTTTFSLIALCAVLIGILLWRLAAANREKKELEERVAALTAEMAVAKRQSAAPPSAKDVPMPGPQAVDAKKAFDQTQRANASFPKLNEELAAARARISELESKVLSLDADRATLAQQRRQEVTASEETCQTKIADMQRSLEAAQGNLKAAQQRASLFETENENLRKAQSAAPVPAAKSATAHPAAEPEAELDELARRRETYLKSLLRRYREIDTEYRALLREPQGARADDAAVFRIQGTLAQAEDDLRQIDSLTAKTLLVEKRREKP